MKMLKRKRGWVFLIPVGVLVGALIGLFILLGIPVVGGIVFLFKYGKLIAILIAVLVVFWFLRKK